MKKNFIYYLLPSIIIGVLGALVIVPVSTYYLAPKDFGVFAIISAITMPLGPLSSTGVGWVLSGNYYKINDGERKSLVFNILFADFILKLFWVILFWVLSSWFLPHIIKEYEPQYDFYFKLTLVAVLFSTFWPSISCLIVLQEKRAVHALFQILQWISEAAATIIFFVVFKFQTITLFLSPLVAGFFSLIMGLWYVRKYVRFEINKKWLKEIFTIGFPSIPANLSEMLTNISDRYFIQRWINLGQLGIYSHSQSYKNLFTMTTKAFTRTFGPSALEVYSLHSDPEKMVRLLRFWYGLLAFGGVAVTLFSYEIVNILTHGKFIAAAFIIPVWFLLMVTSTYGFPYIQFLVVQKESSFLMYTQIFTNAFFIALTAFATYVFGIIGTSLAMVLSNFAMQIVMRMRARKLGCAAIGEKEFFFVSILIMGVYVMTGCIHLGILQKIVMLALLATFVFYRFDFDKEILKMRRLITI